MKSISVDEACERLRLHPRTFSFAKKEKNTGKTKKKEPNRLLLWNQAQLGPLDGPASFVALGDMQQMG